MSATPARPNILWITFEDTSPRFGCYSDPIANTPHLDRLAAEGRRYTRAFAVAGVCAPSRFAVITGLYPIAAGGHHMRTAHTHTAVPELPTPYDAVVPHYVKCLPEYLRAGGYYCSNNEKTDYQFAPPFTAWDDCSGAGHWRNRPDPGQPFFAVFNLGRTHESGMWEEKGAPRTDPDRVGLPPWLPDTRKCREALARQYDHIEDNDARLGELLAELEEDGLTENTIVFLWSDHGEGLPRAKRWLYDAGIRVPLIVRWPGAIDSGGVCEDLTSLIDLGPTVLSLCGLEVPRHMQGHPFLGPDAKKRDCVYGSRDRFDVAYDMVRSVRDRRFKYIRNYCPEKPYLLWIPYRNTHPVMQEIWRLHAEGALDGPQSLLLAHSRPAEELYDLDADPCELSNISKNPEFRADLERLREELDDWLAKTGDLGGVDEMAMKKNWWGGDEQPVTTAPIFIPITADSPGIEPAGEHARLKAPALVQLQSATQGASIGWTDQEGPDPAWRLYTGPIRLGAGITTFRAKAIRIGFHPSAERTAAFEVV